MLSTTETVYVSATKPLNSIGLAPVNVKLDPNAPVNVAVYGALRLL